MLGLGFKLLSAGRSLTVRWLAIDHGSCEGGLSIRNSAVRLGGLLGGGLSSLLLLALSLGILVALGLGNDVGQELEVVEAGNGLFYDLRV